MLLLLKLSFFSCRWS